MAIERISVTIPASFDPQVHSSKLVEMICAKQGPGWALESFSRESKTAWLTRRTTATKVEKDSGADALVADLPIGTKPSDGDRVAAQFADAYPGYHLVKFDPHVGRAVLAKMTEPELRCRFAVATAMGVKPWEVMVRGRRDGGYNLQLPNSYTPSKHDTKLQEVAESVVGRFGWYVDIDPKKLTAKIVPSDPPTFEAEIPTPLRELGADFNKTPFGIKLAGRGERASEKVYLDWKASSWSLVSGLPGGGKTVVINNVIADHLAAGGKLVIVDDQSKAIDYFWCKDYVIDGGWGCDGLPQAVTALSLMYQEGKRRAEWMAENGYVNWQDIPPSDRFEPLLAVVDEVSALLVTERIPAGVDKKLPEVQAILEENMTKFRLQSRIRKIMAEQRFVGMRMLLSTQVTNNSTGLPPSMKALIGAKVLMGSNPSKTQRQQAFNVESAVPHVPENLKAGGPAARGVGAAELEGQAPTVFKGFYSPTDVLAIEMKRRGVPTSTRPAPTEAEIAKHCPPLGGEDLDEDPSESSFAFGQERLPSGKPVSSLDPKFGPGPAQFDENGKKLRGAAAAAKASKAIADASPKAAAVTCFACDKPIDPLTGDCGCS